MTSIHQHQPELHTKNLSGSEAVAKVKELVGKAKTCFFCTRLSAGAEASSRPMNVRTVDDAGRLWFLSASDSSQNQELAENASVRLYFQGSPYSDFMMLTGQAAVSRDRAKIQELWDPSLATWFTEGQDDPRITVIGVTPQDGYYWDTKHGMIIAGIKRAVGAATGQTLDDSIEGSLHFA